jgi:RNA polymerase sigma-70 factor (ECF subfamily)
VQLLLKIIVYHIDMPEDSERQLVIRTLRGEIDAYGRLVQAYQLPVFNVCYRIMGDRGSAEDLTQDTFIRAHQRLDTFDIDRPFGPWIRKIATNLCLNQRKRNRVIIQSIDDELTIDTSSVSANPEITQERLERDQAIRKALLELPPHFQAVIELRHFQDMNYKEIADALDLPLNTAKSHLFRARKLLAKKLENIYAYE